MNKLLKFFITVVFAILIFYTIYFFFGIFRYSHSSDWQTYKKYMWIFKDSVKSDIDTNFSYSYFTKHDVYNNLHYKGHYNIIVWEFKDLNSVDLNKVSMHQNANLNGLKFGSGEILNKKSDLEITIKYRTIINKSFNVSIDSNSEIQRNIDGTNYKGFYGCLNKLSLNNEKGEPQILFNYVKGKTKTVFLIFKGHQNFYLLIVNSDKPFDENIIKIFNLN